MKKIFQIICYYLTPAIGIVALIFYPDRHIFNIFGVLSVLALILIMFIKPIAMISRQKILLKSLAFRRELGVFCFWAALIHSFGYLMLMNFFLKMDLKSPLFWGYVATVLIVVLGMTSNNFAVRLLKRNWKRLQYIAYPALFITMIHVELLELHSFYLTLIGFAIYIILKFVEKFTNKKHAFVS